MQVKPVAAAERRHSQRWKSTKDLIWRVRGQRRPRRGTIPERSLGGMTIAAHIADAAPPGTCLVPADEQTGVRHGFRVAVIRRIIQQPPQNCLLCIEVLS
jgi:hypothetical protein